MYGAEIVYSPGEQGSNGAVAMALEMAEADSRYYMPYQYGNQANPDAHYNGTAVEILEELDEVAAFVAGLGTGGTLMGNGRRLKEENDETLIVAAEPLQGELVQGLRSLDDGFIPPIIDLALLDRKIFVSNRDAVVWTKKLLEEEGLFARRLDAARSPTSPRASREDSTRATSSSSRPTTAGSTCRRASTRSRSSSSRPRASSRPRRSGSRRLEPRCRARAARSRSWSSSSSSCESNEIACLNSRMPRPRLRATTGRRCGPSTSSAITRTTRSSVTPT